MRRAEHENAAYVEASAQRIDGEWRLLDNPLPLFGGDNEVEMRSNDIRVIKVGDWVAFTIASRKKRGKYWQAGTFKRMYPYADFSSSENIELIKRKLASEGIRTTQPSGPWIVRTNEVEVLRVELRQANGTAQLSAANGKVPVFPFDEKSTLNMHVGGEEFLLYDLRPDSPPSLIYDWSSDEEFALRIARSLADFSDPRAKEVIAWLEECAKRGEGLSSVEAADLAAVNEALRAGKLAKRLASDRALLQTFVDALFNDERVVGLLQECVSQVAEQERGRAKAKAEADVQRDIERIRRQRLIELENEVKASAKARHAQDAAAHEKLRDELNAELSTRRAQAEAEIEHSIGNRRATLEALVAELDARCKSLEVEKKKLSAEVSTAEGQMVLRKAEEHELVGRLEDLQVQVKQVASDLAQETKKLIVAQQKCPLPLPPRAPLKVLTRGEAGTTLTQSSFLTEDGARLMAQFLALTLGGEVPALCGPEVQDFLVIAELMFSGGWSARLEADPTVITFEDLWLRPGTEVRTALGQALMIANGVDTPPRTTLAVVERAERSGARFWYPTLVDRVRRGDLPRRLLACVTIVDDNSDEAREILAHAVGLEIRGAFTSAGVLAAVKELAEGAFTELDPGEPLLDLVKAMPVVAPHSSRLGVIGTQRALRVISEANRLGISDQSKSLMHLITGENCDAPISSLSQRSSVHA